MVQLFFHPQGGFVRIACTGKVGPADLCRACDQVLADERYTQGMGRIWDVRECDLTDISSEEVQQLTSYLADHSEDVNHVRVAIVADTPLGFGLARIFSTVSECTAKNVVMPFKSLADAEAWITG